MREPKNQMLGTMVPPPLCSKVLSYQNNVKPTLSTLPTIFTLFFIGETSMSWRLDSFGLKNLSFFLTSIGNWLLVWKIWKEIAWQSWNYCDRFKSLIRKSRSEQVTWIPLLSLKKRGSVRKYFTRRESHLPKSWGNLLKHISIGISMTHVRNQKLNKFQSLWIKLEFH